MKAISLRKPIYLRTENLKRCVIHHSQADFPKSIAKEKKGDIFFFKKSFPTQGISPVSWVCLRRFKLTYTQMIRTTVTNGSATASTVPYNLLGIRWFWAEITIMFALAVCEAEWPHGYASSYAKLVWLELAVYDVPVQSTVSLFWFYIALSARTSCVRTYIFANRTESTFCMSLSNIYRYLRIIYYH